MLFRTNFRPLLIFKLLCLFFSGKFERTYLIAADSQKLYEFSKKNKKIEKSFFYFEKEDRIDERTKLLLQKYHYRMFSNSGIDENSYQNRNSFFRAFNLVSSTGILDASYGADRKM